MTERLPYAASSIAEPYDRLAPLPVSGVLHDIRSLYNVGAFFRTADASGLTHLYLTGVTGTPPHPQIAKTALGAESAVGWSHHPDPGSLLTALRQQGQTLAAIETDRHAVDLFDWRPTFPVTVVFGHEVDGLPSRLLEQCDVRVRIPMLGLKHSLNVATAGGIVFYELLRTYRRRVECCSA